MLAVFYQLSFEHMITLRRETDYAIILLKELSKEKHDCLSLRRISDLTGLSFTFLQKIARKLRKARLIKAEQGVAGGYRLNIPAKRINLKMVVEATEKSAAISPCLCKTGVCPSGRQKCFLKNRLGKINKQIENILKKTTLDKI